jgi:hypothetical protein
MISLPKLKEKQVASRQIKKLVKYRSDKAADEIVPLHKQPESGRYLIQVDRHPTRARALWSFFDN